MKPEPDATRRRLLARFEELTDWLSRHRELWAGRPFATLPVSWEVAHPEISEALRALDPEAVERYANDPGDLPDMPEEFCALALEARELSGWAPVCSLAPPGKPVRGVGARKQRQIQCFSRAAALLAPDGITRWVDWCSGKGHLGRHLGALTSRPVICVEKNPSLCEAGALISEGTDEDVTFLTRDVLLDIAPGFLEPRDGAVALHACGALNQKLLRQAVSVGVRYLVVAPCCYQRIPTMEYQPSSEAATLASLVLDRHSLRLASFDEIAVGPARRVSRRREQAWRLGFDILHRETTGRDEYRPMGSVPRAWLDTSFEEFCRRLAARVKMNIPDGWSPIALEEAGRERSRIASALGLLRGLFRRPLESWLLLDRVLYLFENGYRVSVGTFCDREDTPRNLLIAATHEEIS